MARDQAESNGQDVLRTSVTTRGGADPFAAVPTRSIELKNDPKTDSKNSPNSPNSLKTGAKADPRTDSRTDPKTDPKADLNSDLRHSLNYDLDDDDEEPRFLRTERRVPIRRSPIPKKAQIRVKQALMVAAVVAGLGTLSGAAYNYGIHSTHFRIDSSDNIELNGLQNAAHAQVMDVLGADIGRNVFFVPLDERKKQLEAIPWVESATVMRLLPNRIAVRVEERTPVAFVQMGTKINLIDAHGVVMPPAANKQTKYSFPVIRGITDTEPGSSRAAAMKIYNRLVKDLDVEGSHYSQDISEIDLGDPENVKVIANDAGGTLLVHLGDADFLPRYKLYVTHIAEWRQHYQNLQSVDLRYEGQIIINPETSHAPPPVVKPAQPVESKTPARPARRRRK